MRRDGFRTSLRRRFWPCSPSATAVFWRWRRRGRRRRTPRRSRALRSGRPGRRLSVRRAPPAFAFWHPHAVLSPIRRSARSAACRLSARLWPRRGPWHSLRRQGASAVRYRRLRLGYSQRCNRRLWPLRRGSGAMLRCRTSPVHCRRLLLWLRRPWGPRPISAARVRRPQDVSPRPHRPAGRWVRKRFRSA